MDKTSLLLALYGICWGLVWGSLCATIRLQKQHFLKGWSIPIWFLRNALSSLVGYAFTYIVFQLANCLPLVLDNFRQFPFVSITAIFFCIAIEIPLVWFLGDDIWQ